MSLSRHFYSLDEIQAALQYSTTRNNKKETLFWCQEMISSGLIAETISCLFESWIWHNGAFRLQWIIDVWKTLASDELTETDILLAAYKLSSVNHLRRDNSLWNILILTGCNPDKQPDRVTPKTPSGAVKLFDRIELYFVRAVYQGKAQCAWWSTQFIEAERVWEILQWFAKNVYYTHSEKYISCLKALETYETLLGYKSAEYDVVVRCTAVLSFCIPPKAQIESFKPFGEDLEPDDSMILQELKELEGHKEARIFSIPTMCLYGVTNRGRCHWTQQNFVKLNNVEKYIRGCPFWDEAISEFSISSNTDTEIKWNSEESQEAFYNHYFPDDIPDEWSRTEKIKSHGDGILGPTEKVTIIKYTRNTFGKLTHLAWNTRSVILKHLEKFIDYDCNPLRVIESFSYGVRRSINDHIKLEPVRKKRIVLSY